MWNAITLPSCVPCLRNSLESRDTSPSLASCTLPHWDETELEKSSGTLRLDLLSSRGRHGDEPQRSEVHVVKQTIHRPALNRYCFHCCSRQVSLGSPHLRERRKPSLGTGRALYIQPSLISSQHRDNSTSVCFLGIWPLVSGPRSFFTHRKFTGSSLNRTGASAFNNSILELLYRQVI